MQLLFITPFFPKSLRNTLIKGTGNYRTVENSLWQKWIPLSIDSSTSDVFNETTSDPQDNSLVIGVALAHRMHGKRNIPAFLPNPGLWLIFLW